QLGVFVAEEFLQLGLAPVGRRLERTAEQDAGIAQVFLLAVRVIVLHGAIQGAVAGLRAVQHLLAGLQALGPVETVRLADLYPKRVVTGHGIFSIISGTGAGDRKSV